MRFNKDKILRIFYPYKCEVCGRIVPIEKDYCDCFNEKIRRVSINFCEGCGKDISKCVCHDSKIILSHITAPFVYSGFIKNYILNYKFNGKKRFHKKLGEEMAERFTSCYPDVSADIVTFVPVSAKTLSTRGYNQSELLADVVSEKLSLPVVPTLIKIRETTAQSKLGSAERSINLKDALTVIDKADVAGKTVILCDDIKTTGNTLSICTDLLLGIGAKDVYCLCAAVSEYEKLPF